MGSRVYRSKAARHCARKCKSQNKHAAMGECSPCTPADVAVCVKSYSRRCSRKRRRSCRRSCVATTPAMETTVPEVQTTVMGEETTAPEYKTTVAEEKTTAPEYKTTVAEEETTAPVSSGGVTSVPPQRVSETSSAGSNVGLVVGLVVGAAVAAGVAAVAVGFFVSGSAATASAPLTQSLMSGASVSPLYTADISSGTNALHGGV